MRLPHYRSTSWIRWSTRKPSSRHSVRYLRNCHRAATFFVTDYLLAPPGQRPSFADMTRAMHVLMARGLGPVPFGSRYDASTMYPDRTRAELLADRALGYGRVLCPMFVGDAVDLAIEQARSSMRSKHVLVARGTLLLAGRRHPFSLRFVDGVCRAAASGEPRAARARIRLPTPGSSTLIVEPSCDPAGLARSFAAAGREMERIAAMRPEATRRSGGQRRRLLRRLARYYALMVHGHVYLTQNNSMLMNQMNCITFLHFGQACMHHNLDALTFVLDEAEFARAHQRVLAAENAHAS